MSALPSRTPSLNMWVGGFGQHARGGGGMALFIKPQGHIFYDPVDRYFVELPAGVIKGYFQSQSLQESRAENTGHSEEE